MDIGFLTNCLKQRTLPEIITWAGAHGFTALEVACWPRPPDVADPSLDIVNFDRARADELNALAEQNHVTLSCLTYCANTLAHDPAQRTAVVEHLYRVVDAAQLLGVRTVSAFVGRDETKTQRENFDEMERVFAPLLEHAAARGVRIGIENCPMVGWSFEGLPGNLAYSPRIWDEMFRRLPHANFGLNLDPSHLAWLGVDYDRAARDYGARVFHVHAKDTEIFRDRRNAYSILDASWNTWWVYRLPGRGEIDWKRWSATLREIAYSGPLSIELEDPDYERSEDLVKEGLLLGKQHLETSLS